MLRRTLIGCLAALLAGGLFTSAARAQFHIDFLVGGHGHHHHHHHGHHHWHHPHYSFGWYPSYYYNPPVEYVYVTPPPPRTVVYTEQAAAAPASSQPARASSVAAAPRPAARPNPVPASSDQGITIRNPKDSGGNVSYVIDGQNEYELQPGQSRSLAGQRYVIEFDRGGDFGSIEREIESGDYEFVVNDAGWDLQRVKNDNWRSALSPAVRKNSLPARR